VQKEGPKILVKKFSPWNIQVCARLPGSAKITRTQFGEPTHLLVGNILNRSNLILKLVPSDLSKLSDTEQMERLGNPNRCHVFCWHPQECGPHDAALAREITGGLFREI
jgi:hypothetical protein